MKLTTSRPQRGGFTLIELLVVVAIIAILAALGFGAGATAINNAKKLTAKNECTNLVQAVNGYFDEYSHYPNTGGGTGDAIVKSNSGVMNILLGLGSTGETENPKQIRYYQGPEAKGSGGREYGGLLRTGSSAELFDVWKKIESGAERYYYLSWDSNYDDEITDPFSNRVIYNTVIAWSTGKDGKEVRGKESDTKNRDNVYSWK